MSTLEYKDIIGISNATDTKRIPKGYVQAAVNVDIDDSKKIHRRRGRDSFDTTGTYSMWSNQSICLCVQSGDLKEITIDISTMTPTFTTLLADVGTTTMQYQNVADMVFFQTPINGYIRDHTAHAFPEISKTFKDRMMGGQLMEYWNSRLWVFQDEKLLYSDAGMPMIRDERHNFISFNSKGKMVRAVSDGLYISDSEKCMFLQGGAGDPPLFKRIDITDYPCIEGSAVTSDGDDTGNGLTGKVVYWTTHNGVFKGLPGGVVIEVTKGNFLLNHTSQARAILLSRTIDKSTFSQYLVCYDFEPGYGGMRFELSIPAITVHSHID